MVTNNDFKKQMEMLQIQVLEKKTLIHNEENTKQALINPFLLLLGYNVHDPNEVEFTMHNLNIIYQPIVMLK